MRVLSTIRTGVLLGAACLSFYAQNPPPREGQADNKGILPRATPSDYLSQVKVGQYTLAAEFKGHSIPNDQGPLVSEEYVVVEVAFFGAPGAKLVLSPEHFSLRLNGKKNTIPSRHFGLVLGSVKDPEQEPTKAKSKSKTNIGGSEREPGEPEAPVKIPLETQRAWAQRVQQAVLPEGERPLPQAGVVFFPHRGKTQGLRAVELVYNGPAGEASVALEP